MPETQTESKHALQYFEMPEKYIEYFKVREAFERAYLISIQDADIVRIPIYAGFSLWWTKVPPHLIRDKEVIQARIANSLPKLTEMTAKVSCTPFTGLIHQEKGGFLVTVKFSQAILMIEKKDKTFVTDTLELALNSREELVHAIFHWVEVTEPVNVRAEQGAFINV